MSRTTNRQMISILDDLEKRLNRHIPQHQNQAEFNNLDNINPFRNQSNMNNNNNYREYPFMNNQNNYDNISPSMEYKIRQIIKDEFNILLLPYQKEMHNEFNIMESKIEKNSLELKNLQTKNLNNLQNFMFNSENEFNLNQPNLMDNNQYVLRFEYDNKMNELTHQITTLNSFTKSLKDAFDNLPENVEKHYIEFPEKRLKYYRMLKEGQYWKDLPLDMQKEAMGKSFYLGGGKTGFLRRLSYSKPSPTLVTNPTMPATDLAHPTEDRPLSVEEYACIQEFPQDWQICGAILDQYKQIGNAVPIKLGEAIAKTILDDMNGIHYENTGFSYSRYKNTDEISWMEFMKKQLEKAEK